MHTAWVTLLNITVEMGMVGVYCGVNIIKTVHDECFTSSDVVQTNTIILISG